jgi:hypothetical protein
MGQDPKPSPRSETRRGPEVPLGGSLLVQQGNIIDEEYASALSRSEQSGHSIWTALRAASLILPGRAGPVGKGGPSNEAAPLQPPLTGDGRTGASPAPFGVLDASSPIP